MLLIHLPGIKPHHSTLTIDVIDLVSRKERRQRKGSAWSLLRMRGLSRVIRLIHSCKLIAQSSNSSAMDRTCEGLSVGTVTPFVFTAFGDKDRTAG